MTDLTCDVAIIGAGTAGLAAERSAREAGATTLLIDEGFSGTTCASVGCMPSKLLIAAGRAAHGIRRADAFGIVAPALTVDGAAVMQRVRKLRDEFVAEAKKSIDGLPERVALCARARFTSPTQLTLDDGRTVDAKAIVIATGARPKVPETLAALGDLVLTNETIFELPDLPASIAVIGAGPLGLELAQALARLGIDVEVFDQGKAIAGLPEGGLARDFERIIATELPIRLGVEIDAVGDGDGVTLTWKGSSSGHKRFARLLVATGRPPALKNLDLAAARLQLDKHGTPLFDETTLQCGDSSVFIAGDANASRPVLHEANFEGELAGRNAASWPQLQSIKRSVSLAITFTDPPLAMIGDPKDEGHVIGRASYEDQGCARIDARNAGFACLHAARPDGRVVGAVLAAPGADHMAHLLAWAIERGETASSLMELPLYHPTVEEGLKPALREICDALDAKS